MRDGFLYGKEPYMRLKHLFSLLVLFALTATTGHAITYYSRATGNWNAATTWSTAGCGGAAAAGTPTTNDVVFICNGNTVSVTANVTVNSVTIQNGGTLQTGTTGGGANRTVTINGNFVILNGGTYIHNNNQVAATTIFNGTENFEPTSTFRVNAWSGTGASLVTGCSSNFGHVTLNWNPGLFYWNNNGLGYTRTIAGTFTVNTNCATYLDNTAGSKTFSINQLTLNNSYLRFKQLNDGVITVNIPGGIIINGSSSWLYGVYGTNSDITFNVSTITQNNGSFYGIYNGDGDVTFNVSSVWIQQDGDFRGIYNTVTYTAGIPSVNVNSLIYLGGTHIVNYSCNPLAQTLNYNCINSVSISFGSATGLFAFNRLALLGVVAPGNSLNLHVGGNFNISGPATGEFNSNNGTGNEVIDIDGSMSILNGNNYFNVVPNNLSNGHSVLLTIGGGLSVSGGNSVLSSETGNLTAQISGNFQQSGGVLSLKSATGRASMLINGTTSVSGGTLYFQQNIAVASADSIDITSNGNFSQSGGIINFSNNVAATGKSVWFMKGATYTLSGNGGMTRSGSGTASNFGYVIFSRAGVITASRTGSHLIQQVKQVVETGCTLDVFTGGLQVAAHNSAMLDMLTVKGGGVINANALTIFSSAQFPNTGITVQANGRYRLSHISGFYNGSPAASLSSAGNMDYHLDSLSVVEYYGSSPMILSGINVGTAVANRHKYGILDINHTGSGPGFSVVPTNAPSSVNAVYIRHQLRLTTGILNLSGTSVSTSFGGRTIHIERPDPSAITVVGGSIISDSKDHSAKVNWNLSNVAGTYTLPFFTHANNPVNITYALVSGNAGVVSFSTYPSDVSALPWPPAVTNLNSLIGLTPDNRNATVKRFWKVQTSGSPVADLTLQYHSAELPPMPYSLPSQMLAQHYDFPTNRWQPALPAQTTLGYTVSVPAITTQSDWAIANFNSPLPVAWLSIKAVEEDRKVNVMWATAFEKDNDRFEVQRSVDRMSVESLGEVKSYGNAQTPQTYSFKDHNPVTGVSYYRVKQIDLNGDYSFSDWVSVTRNSIYGSAISFWPNPATDYLLAHGLSGGEEIAVFDPAGRLLVKTTAEAGQQLLDISRLSPGIYTVEVKNNQERIHSERIVKK